MLLTDAPGGPVLSQTLFSAPGSPRHTAYSPTRSAEIKPLILKGMSVLEREVWIPSKGFSPILGGQRHATAPRVEASKAIRHSEFGVVGSPHIRNGGVGWFFCVFVPFYILDVKMLDAATPQ